MLADRHYMQDTGHRPPMSMLNKLFIAMVATFVLQNIDQVYWRGNLSPYFALTIDGIRSGYIWQFLTFNFMHGGFGHILWNCLLFWIVGREIERVLGARRFLFAFLYTGAAGGVLQIILMFALPKVYGEGVVGASAGVSGTFAIFALLYRDQVFRVCFILPVRALNLLWASLAIAGFFTLVPPPDGVAHAGHLGGLLAGMLFVRLGWHHDYRPLPWMEWWESFRSRRKPFIQRVERPVKKISAKSSAPKPVEDPDFIASQVDPILDKISEKGLHSLTDKEREILEKARNRMGR